MPMESKTRVNLIFVLILVLSLVLTLFITLKYNDLQIQKVRDFDNYYFTGIINFNNGVFDKADAELNYDSWSFYYDEGYYFDSIEFCVEARELYASANSYHQDSVSNFEEAYKLAEQEYKEIIEYYIKASDQAIKINWAMYEACEYFESASALYSKDLLESGNLEVEIGNEKIDLHDSLIIEYNQYVSKIGVLEDNF